MEEQPTDPAVQTEEAVAEGVPRDPLEGLERKYLGTVAGLDPRTKEPVWLGYKNRVHVLVVGVPGTGKSTWVLFQVLQHIKWGEGVIVFDPHGTLITLILSHIKPKDRKRVVLIDPTTAWKHGAVVQWNPFEAHSPFEQAVAAERFMSSLQKLFISEETGTSYWGPRLEQIMRNALNALYEWRPDFNIFDLSEFLQKETVRQKVLKAVTSKEVQDFWFFTFPNMKDDAITSPQTKIAAIAQSRILLPMFSGRTNKFTFRKLMDEGKIVLIRLPEGELGGVTVVNFLGSLLLAAIYHDAMSREDLPLDKRRPVWVYIDEAHRFLTSALREGLQALRKYKVFLTCVSQSLSQYGANESDVSQLCSTKIAFKPGWETATKLEKEFLPIIHAYHMINFPNYMFAICTEVDGRPAREVLLSVDVGMGPYDPDEVARASLEVWGAPIERSRLEEPVGAPRVIKVGTPRRDPVEFYILSYLSMCPEGRSSWESLKKSLGEKFKWKPADLYSAAKRLCTMYLLDAVDLYADSAGRKTNFPVTHYALTKSGWKELYPEMKKLRTGGLAHALLLGKAMKFYMEQDLAPALATENGEEEQEGGGETGGEVTVTVEVGGVRKEVTIEKHPDMVVYRPVPTASGPSQTHWDLGSCFVVEAEVYPEKHPERVAAHFLFASQTLKRPVVFLTTSQEKAEAIRRTVESCGGRVVDSILSDFKLGCAEVKVFEPLRAEDLKGPDMAWWVRDILSKVRDKVPGFENPEMEEARPWVDALEGKAAPAQQPSAQQPPAPIQRPTQPPAPASPEPSTATPQVETLKREVETLREELQKAQRMLAETLGKRGTAGTQPAPAQAPTKAPEKTPQVQPSPQPPAQAMDTSGLSPLLGQPQESSSSESTPSTLTQALSGTPSREVIEEIPRKKRGRPAPSTEDLRRKVRELLNRGYTEFRSRENEGRMYIYAWKRDEKMGKWAKTYVGVDSKELREILRSFKQEVLRGSETRKREKQVKTRGRSKTRN